MEDMEDIMEDKVKKSRLNDYSNVGKEEFAFYIKTITLPQ